MTTETLRVLLVAMLVLPLAAAVAAAVLGPRRGDAIRWVSLAATLASLVLALVLAFNFADRQARTPAEPLPTTFQPEFVPGDPADTHGTTWNLLGIGGGTVQFYLGIDGLNVWLIVLTALLLVAGVLVSWTAV